MAYDKKFKKRTIEYHEEGNSRRKTAETFGISPNTLNTWLKEYREHGEFTVKAKPANNTKLTEKALLEYFENNEDSYQEETAKHFGVSQSGILRALKRLKITRKKNKTFQGTRPRKSVCLPSVTRKN
ncbi:MAG: IS630 transposase-related protein [Defluviitaleaceae bacterium]|nr:IS630 transposase-related protein [Defluviitaleaceae bacterium]